MKHANTISFFLFFHPIHELKGATGVIIGGIPEPQVAINSFRARRAKEKGDPYLHEQTFWSLTAWDSTLGLACARLCPFGEWRPRQKKRRPRRKRVLPSLMRDEIPWLTRRCEKLALKGMQRLAAGWGTREGGRNGRSFPLQRDGESLKGGRNLFATRSNDRSARWNSEYLCRFFSFLFFFLGSRGRIYLFPRIAIWLLKSFILLYL